MAPDPLSPSTLTVTPTELLCDLSPMDWRTRLVALIRQSREIIDRAKQTYLERIRLWYPQTAALIDELQRKAIAAGFTGPQACWGHGLNGKAFKELDQPVGKLCSSC
jgi:hypothetical protein